MNVRGVAKERLAEVRDAAWVDRSRRPYAEGDIVWVPAMDGEPFDREIPERHHYRGRGFFMLGDVAVIHGRRPREDEVEEIIRFRHPHGILWIESLMDDTRTPRTEVLRGDVGEVRHRESGYTYFLDPRQVMFAQGNRNEKMRMAQLVRGSPEGSRVADMFAGIGYFTIPMAGGGATVHAMEIDPVAFGYLQRNIEENCLVSRVEAALGDCRDLLDGDYDRVVMGHFNAIRMLLAVFDHVHTGSVIHLHSIGPVTDAISKLAENAGFSATIHVHKVKKYRPHAMHVVQDVTLS
jgi:tRNA wybutosine-synthesizing protein 2